MEHIADSVVSDFQENGAVCLRGVFDGQWIEKIRRGIATNRLSPSPCGEELTGGGGSYFNDYCNWQTIDEFRDFAFNSPAAELAAKLMDSQVSSLSMA